MWIYSSVYYVLQIKCSLLKKNNFVVLFNLLWNVILPNKFVRLLTIIIVDLLKIKIKKGN